MRVDELVFLGLLDEDHARNLSKRLDKALKRLVEEKATKAIADLNRFQTESQNLIDRGALDSVEGSNLIAGARSVIQGFGC